MLWYRRRIRDGGFQSDDRASRPPRQQTAVTGKAAILQRVHVAFRGGVSLFGRTTSYARRDKNLNLSERLF